MCECDPRQLVRGRSKEGQDRRDRLFSPSYDP
jgi:hypothetical protein